MPFAGVPLPSCCCFVFFFLNQQSRMVAPPGAFAVSTRCGCFKLDKHQPGKSEPFCLINTELCSLFLFLSHLIFFFLPTKGSPHLSVNVAFRSILPQSSKIRYFPTVKSHPECAFDGGYRQTAEELPAALRRGEQSRRAHRAIRRPARCCLAAGTCPWQCHAKRIAVGDFSITSFGK